MIGNLLQVRNDRHFKLETAERANCWVMASVGSPGVLYALDDANLVPEDGLAELSNIVQALWNQ
ncbi:MAG: hypothetical protein DHS20C04_06140 [Hyphococcus sp.]|nr:MAG: hypothetical protein DHS20C04_06140 [Marinicaulis sp.]